MNVLCQMTGISRAGYYRWRVPPPSFPVEMELRDAMQQVALEFPSYGYRRITRELHRRGFAVNHKRVLRLMRADNLLCRDRRSPHPSIQSWTNSNPERAQGSDCIRASSHSNPAVHSLLGVGSTASSRA